MLNPRPLNNPAMRVSTPNLFSTKTDMVCLIILHGTPSSEMGRVQNFKYRVNMKKQEKCYLTHLSGLQAPFPHPAGDPSCLPALFRTHHQMVKSCTHPGANRFSGNNRRASSLLKRNNLKWRRACNINGNHWVLEGRKSSMDPGHPIEHLDKHVPDRCLKHESGMRR
jgi:hypothetical protein